MELTWLHKGGSSFNGTVKCFMEAVLSSFFKEQQYRPSSNRAFTSSASLPASLTPLYFLFSLSLALYL